MSDYPLESPQESLSWAQKLTGFDDGKIDDAGLEIDPALSFPWPDDPDERIWAPVYMSLNEYTALLSSVDVGAAIAWTNDALLVYYILVRNYSGGSMQFCEKVADCFTNDPEFRQSVIDALKTDQNFIDAVQDLSGRSSGRQIEGELFTGDCDESVVAGRVMAIIDRLNSRNADFLEIVEVGTNDEERVSSVLAAIPGLGESPVDEIIDIVQTFLEDFTENYAAAITDDWLEEVYFDIWCATLERPDCTLTFQDLFDYFNGRVGADLSVTSTIQNIFSFIVNGDFSTDDLIASGMYLIQLSYILAGLEFNGMSVPTIGALARDADPSSAWLDWPECGAPTTGLWSIQSGYAGLTEAQSGKITTQNSGSVTFSTDEPRDGEYRIIAQYNSYGSPVTIVTSSNPGSILAKYHGVGSSLFGGTLANSQLIAGDQLNYLYFTHTAPFTLSLTFTP